MTREEFKDKLQLISGKIFVYSDASRPFGYIIVEPSFILDVDENGNDILRIFWQAYYNIFPRPSQLEIGNGEIKIDLETLNIQSVIDTADILKSNIASLKDSDNNTIAIIGDLKAIL